MDDTWTQLAVLWTTVATFLSPRVIAFVPVQGTKEDIRAARQRHATTASLLVGAVAAIIASCFTDWDFGSIAAGVMGAGAGKMGGQGAYDAHWKRRSVNRDRNIEDMLAPEPEPTVTMMQPQEWQLKQPGTVVREPITPTRPTIPADQSFSQWLDEVTPPEGTEIASVDDPAIQDGWLFEMETAAQEAEDSGF